MNDTRPPLEVSCPTCQRSVIWSTQSPFRPFCTERCRLIDLGVWANEGYRVEVEVQEETTLSESDSFFEH